MMIGRALGLVSPSFLVSDSSGGSRGVCDRDDHPLPLELVPILKTYAKCA